MRQKFAVFSTCLGLSLTFVTGKAQVSSPVECQPKTELRALRGGSAGDAQYALPVPLRNIATIKRTDNAVCNLLVRHKAINGGAWLLASKDREVSFKDASKNGPTEWNWTLPGASVPSQQTQDASAKYKVQGVFDFPTLEATTMKGKSTYHPNLKIKAGGIAEITTIDMRQWGTTYQLAMLPFSDGIDVGGCLGGTNSKGIVGVGNLFMVGSDDAYLEGVNVYLHHKPKKYKKDATLVLKVWMVKLPEEGDLKLTALPVEAQTLKMKDIKADGEDGAWAPVENGAVAAFRFDVPLDLYGKSLFFISVEGFSNDPSTEDFCILTDQIGIPLSEVDVNNRLAHNSFARLKGETDYLRPISMYGGGTGSFAICPLLQIQLPTTGISSAKTLEDNCFKVVVTEGQLDITTAQPGRISVLDIAGKTIKTITAKAGKTVIPVSELPRGLYLVKGPQGKTIKVKI